MDALLYFFASSAGVILLIAIPLIVIIIAVLTLLAINHLHKIPAMQQSLENCEKYLKYLAIEKKKGETVKTDQPA
jgi:ABC-type transport system involved in cytochrome bd biosynthesis fused ATPase/permease subunit